MKFSIEAEISEESTPLFQCRICKNYCEEINLLSCKETTNCSYKVHLICICIDKVLSKNYFDIWYYIWFKFQPFSNSKDLILNYSKKDIIGELELVEERFLQVLNSYNAIDMKLIKKEEISEIFEVNQGMEKTIKKPILCNQIIEIEDVSDRDELNINKKTHKMQGNFNDWLDLDKETNSEIEREMLEIPEDREEDDELLVYEDYHTKIEPSNFHQEKYNNGTTSYFKQKIPKNPNHHKYREKSNACTTSKPQDSPILERISPKPKKLEVFLQVQIEKLQPESTKTQNYGYNCPEHPKNLICHCENQPNHSEEIVNCEHCDSWFYSSCLKTEYIKENPFYCEDCLIVKEELLRDLVICFQEINMDSLKLFDNLKELIERFKGKYLTIMEMIIVGVLLERFIKGITGKEKGLNRIVELIYEFMVNWPCFMGHLMLNPLKELLKRVFWEEYLGNSNDINAFNYRNVKSCIDLNEHFDEKAHKELEILIKDLINLGNQLNAKEIRSILVDILEEIFNTQKIIKKICQNQEISDKEYIDLSKIALKYPEIHEFHTMLDHLNENKVLLKEFTKNLYEIEDFQNILRKRLEKKEILDFLKDTKTLQKNSFDLSEILDVLVKIMQMNRKEANNKGISTRLERFHCNLTKELQEFDNIDGYFKDLNQFDIIGRKLMVNWFSTPNKLLFCELWREWRAFQYEIDKFNNYRANIVLSTYIWKEFNPNSFRLNKTKNNEESLFIKSPLLYLCQRITIQKEPFIDKSPLFKALSKDKLDQLIQKGHKLKEKLPFLYGELLRLEDLFLQSKNLEKLLEKIFYCNKVDCSLARFWEDLLDINLYLPILGKIQCLADNPNEIKRLKNSKEALEENIENIRLLELKAKVFGDGFFELLGLYKARKLEKRVRRLLGGNDDKITESFIGFLDRIKGNFKLFKGISHILLPKGINCFKDPENVIILLSNTLKTITNSQEISIIEANNESNEISLSSEEKIDIISNLLVNYLEIDRNPSLEIIIKDFNPFLLNLRWFFWLLKLKASFKQENNKLSLDAFIEHQAFLNLYIEPLLNTPKTIIIKGFAEYRTFKALEKELEEWDNQLKILCKDFEINRKELKLEEFYNKLTNLRGKMPLTNPLLDRRLNAFCLGLQASLKAKTAISLVDIEKKQISFTCFQTLEAFFQQKPEYPLPFSDITHLKYIQITEIKSRITQLQDFLSHKTLNFNYKTPEIKLLSPFIFNIKASFLIKKESLTINPYGIYDYYLSKPIIHYKELGKLISELENQHIGLKNEKKELKELKKNCEVFSKFIEKFQEDRPLIKILNKWSLEEVFRKLKGFRNSLFSANLVQCWGIDLLRIFEWGFYCKGMLEGNFWFLERNREGKEIKEKLLKLTEFNDGFQCFKPIKPLNDRVQVERLLKEGEKIKGGFKEDLISLFEWLKEEMGRFEGWFGKEWEIYCINYEKYERYFKGKCCSIKEICLNERNFSIKEDFPLNLEGELFIEECLKEMNPITIKTPLYKDDFLEKPQLLLKKLVNNFLKLLVFDQEVLDLVYLQVLAYQKAEKFWKNAKETGFSDKISEEMVFWLPSIREIPEIDRLFDILRQILLSLKRKYKSLIKKGSQKKLLRLLKLYRNSNYSIPEIDKLDSDYKRSINEIEVFRKEFKGLFKLEENINLWESISKFKKGLYDRFSFRYIEQFQIFWLEILEKQMDCLREILNRNNKGYQKRKNGDFYLYNIKLENSIINENKMEEKNLLNENKMNDDEENEKKQLKFMISLCELEEINKESQGLSKPNRDFLSKLLLKCENLANNVILKDWIEDDIKRDNTKVSKFRFMRYRNYYLLKEIFDKLNISINKKIHLAKYIEKKAFKKFQNKEEYEQEMRKVREKANFWDGEKNGLEWFVIGVQKRDNELIEGLKKELILFCELD